MRGETVREFVCPACTVRVSLPRRVQTNKSRCPACTREVRWPRPIPIRRIVRESWWPVVAIWSVAALGALGCVALYFVGKETGDGEAKRLAPVAEKSSDYAVYTAELKRRTPFDVQAFTAAGLKAESYSQDEQRGVFKEVVIVVDPINLTDTITGKTARFTRAKLILKELPPPSPPRTGDLRGYANRAYASAYNSQLEWATVEMLP